MNRKIAPLVAVLFSIGVSSFVGCASSKTSVRELTREEHADLLIRAASAAIEDQDLVGALKNLEQAEKLQPNSPALFNVRAAVFYARKELPRALEQARLSVQKDPKFNPGLTTLGKILLDLGRFKEAVIPLRTAADDPMNPESFKAFTHLGVIAYRENRWKDAQHELDRAIDLSGGRYCMASYYRGHLRLREGRFKEAIRDYSAATRRMCGRFAEAHLALATAYERSGQNEMARKKYLEIQQIFQTSDSEVADRAMERLRAIP